MIKRSPFKRRTPKKRTGHDKTMLAACKGNTCYLRIPNICIGGTETVVPCHANWAEYGKGMGLKAKDKFTVPGCGACHYWLDFGPAANTAKKAAWQTAYEGWEPVRETKLSIRTVA